MLVLRVVDRYSLCLRSNQFQSCLSFELYSLTQSVDIINFMWRYMEKPNSNPHRNSHLNANPKPKFDLKYFLSNFWWT